MHTTSIQETNRLRECFILILSFALISFSGYRHYNGNPSRAQEGAAFFLDFPRKRGVFSGICFVISSAFRNFVFYPGKLLKKYEAPADKLVQIYKSTSSP
jgi:hypothetical protein